MKQLSRETFQSDSVALVRIEPARKAYRFYRAALWPDLFGGVALVREWGRIGQPGRLRCDPYPDAAAARDALERLARRKRRKGYRAAT